MKQSDWMKGLLWAEEEKKRLTNNSVTKRFVIEILKSEVRLEGVEYLYCEDWIDGVEYYIKHYEERLL